MIRNNFDFRIIMSKNIVNNTFLTYKASKFIVNDIIIFRGKYFIKSNTQWF